MKPRDRDHTGAGRLVSAIEDPDSAAEARNAAGVESGGGRKRARLRSGLDRVDAIPVFALRGYDRQVMLFREGTASAHQGSRGVRLPPHLGHGVDQQMHLGRTMSPQVSV